jgi:FMN phosphatase YigB (HAD superfamily)
MNELRIVIVHYHLLPGGVASVIRDSLVALARHGRWKRIDARILSGSGDSVNSFLEGLRRRAGIALNASIEHWPQLGYRAEDWPSREAFLSEARQLANRLESVCREHRADLLWAHNPTVGKNPALTEGIRILAERSNPFRVLYHLHDFAECSRFGNLRRLHRAWSGGGLDELYPQAPGAALVTLTEADRERLIAAGYPEESVFALSDPVEAELDAKPFSPGERAEMDRRIAAWSRRQGFRFTEGGRWLLAPIRAIRRKNVLEMALLIRLLGPQWRLLVTLDCNSEPERPYAEYVKDSFRYTQTEATLGFGASLFEPPFTFERFYASVDAVATASLLEGFGLVFAESVFARRPLIGRDLPSITGELPGIQREGLYSELRVSLGENERQRLRALYREKLGRCARQADIGETARDEALAAFDRIFEQPEVDFAFLDLPAQARMLQRMDDPMVRGETAECNRELLNRLNGALCAPSADRKEQLIGKVGLEAFARRFEVIFDGISTDCGKSHAPSGDSVSKRMARGFFQPIFLPLILDAGDEWRDWPRNLLPRFLGDRGPALSEKGVSIRTARTPRVVFWDVYGTLIEPEWGDLQQRLRQRLSPVAFREALDAGGLDTSSYVKDVDRVFLALIEEAHSWGRRNGQRQPEVVVENIWQKLVYLVLPGQWTSIDQARYIAAWYELSTNRTRLRPGAVDAIVRLNEMGFTQGILSNSQFYTPEILRYLLGDRAWSAFDPDLLLWSFEMGAAKPDPAPFARARALLRARGLGPHQVILVGDSAENDVAPAKAWGWKSARVLPSKDTEGEPSSGEADQRRTPDFECRDLAELVAWLEG